MGKQKKCFKCKKKKGLDCFYKHRGMKDGRLNKCKTCTKKDTSTGIHPVTCKICKKEFFVSKSELTSRNGKRGTGRKTCSRECWYKWFQGENVYNYKGQEAGYQAIHKQISKKLGTPNYCEICKTTDPKKPYHWSNKSGKYLIDTKDWQRLCVPCHSTYDLERRKEFKVNCIVCSKEVLTKSKKRRFCTKRCSGKHYRALKNI